MNKIRGAFLILLVNAIFAFVFSLEQFALSHSYPFFITGLRMASGGLLLGVYQWIINKSAFSFSRVKSPLSFAFIFFLIAFFNIYLANGAEVWGLQYISSAKAAFISNLAPFFSAAISYFYFNERMNGKKFLGLMLAFIGFMPVIVMQSNCEKSLPHLGFFTAADLSLLLATFSFVYGWVLVQQLVKSKEYDATVANALSMLLGAAFCFLHSFVMEPWDPVPFKANGDWATLWFLIFFMVFISNIVAYQAYTELLKKYSATFLSFTCFSSYLCAAAYDWMFSGPVIPWQVWTGSGVFLIGLYIFYREERAQGYINHT